MGNQMVHFLLVFDHARGELVVERSFTNGPAAARAYEEAEREHASNSELEIVLVGADSIETIHATHGQYFAGSPLASKYLSIG